MDIFLKRSILHWKLQYSGGERRLAFDCRSDNGNLLFVLRPLKTFCATVDEYASDHTPVNIQFTQNIKVTWIEKQHYTMIINTMRPSTVTPGVECVLDSGSKTNTFSRSPSTAENTQR